MTPRRGPRVAPQHGTGRPYGVGRPYADVPGVADFRRWLDEQISQARSQARPGSDGLRGAGTDFVREAPDPFTARSRGVLSDEETGNVLRFFMTPYQYIEEKALGHFVELKGLGLVPLRGGGAGGLDFD